MCRGACGPDCPEQCETEVRFECVDSRFFRSVTVYDCGSHEGCREHDDCLDKCTFRDPNSTDGIGFYIGVCARDCHEEAVLNFGFTTAREWAKGDGPQPDRIRFEYTKKTTDGREQLFRCPRGLRLVCSGGPNGGAYCVPYPEDEDLPEEDLDPSVQAIGVSIGPQGGCVEKNETLHMFAAVHGLRSRQVRWSASGPGVVDDDGILRPAGDGVIIVRAESISDPEYHDEAEISVGGCSCSFTVVLSGDVSRGHARGKVAHFSTAGMATIVGGFTNPAGFEDAMELFGGAMGEEAQERAEAWRREMEAMPRETLGLSLIEMDPEGGDAQMIGAMAGGVRLQASVMNDPIEPGFAGGLPLSLVSISTGDWTESGSQQIRYEWAPGARGDVRLTISQYTGASLQGTISGFLYGQGVFNESTGEAPVLSFSASFYALEFDPLSLDMGCLAIEQPAAPLP